MKTVEIGSFQGPLDCAASLRHRYTVYMGGWELIIALFGGAWYVISAITAANEKKKKKAQRKLALQAEDLASKPTTESTQNPLNPTAAKETSLSPKRVSEPLPIRKPSSMSASRLQAKPVPKATAGPQQTNIMREVRRSWSPCGRNSDSRPSRPSSRPASPSLKVPPATPSKIVEQQAAAANTNHHHQGVHGPRRLEWPQWVRNRPRQKLAGILKSRGGKQAMVLSEIFQPPVSLRASISPEIV